MIIFWLIVLGISVFIVYWAYFRLSPEQKMVSRYFIFGEYPIIGLLLGISDAEYDRFINQYVEQLNLKKKALDKLGLDESQAKELPPICLADYYFDEKENNLLVREGKDRKDRSSGYQVSWLFFTQQQVYLHQYTLNLNSKEKKEVTEEYFWKDITNFSTSSESMRIARTNSKGKITYKNVNTKRFAMVVPGDKFYCSMKHDDDASEKAVRGMQTYLREKKSQA